MVSMLHRKFFVLEAESVFSNMVLSLDTKQDYVFLCLLSILTTVILTTPGKELTKESFFHLSSSVAFYMIKIKIKYERRRRYS